jgi:hypothetical protein
MFYPEHAFYDEGTCISHGEATVYTLQRQIVFERSVYEKTLANSICDRFFGR